jgi:hypothetical protein
MFFHAYSFEATCAELTDAARRLLVEIMGVED